MSAERYDETHPIVTDDGWRIVLFRFRSGLRARQPVLLCPGLGVGHRHLDVDDRRSLARHLLERGFDVWLLELRGGRDCTAPKGDPPSWSFDAYVDHDLPAAVRFIQRHTGHERLDWVGHSLGGTLLYAFLSGPFGEAIRRAVTLAAPCRFGVLTHLQTMARLWKPDWPTVDQGPMYAFAGAFLEHLLPCDPKLLPAPVRMLFHPRNVEGWVVKKASEHLPTAISGPLMAQLGGWVQSGAFTGLDGRDYWAGLRAVEVPVRVLVGEADEFTPAESVVPVLEQLAGDGDAHVIGTSHGYPRSYGHGDLIFGIDSPRLVYPLVSQWLVAP